MDGRRLPTNAAEETEMRSERLSAKEAAAGACRMFSDPEDRNAVIDNLKAAAAIDKNVAFEASPFTTMLELEVGKELDQRITAGSKSAHDEGASVRNFEFADPVGHGEQAGRNFSPPPPSEEEEETELRAERMSAKEARAYGMFSSPEDRNDMINKMKAAAAIDKNVAFEASPFTTVLELEVGKELDKRITAAGGSVPDASAGVRNFEFADPVGRGEQAGRNFSPPPEEETELRAERMSAKEARAYGMFSSPEDHNDMINKMKAAAAIDKNVAFEASPFTTVLEVEVSKELDKRITAAGGSVPDAGAGVRNFEFADPVTTVDMARMKADETIAEANSAAMKVAKESGDVVAGHKWF